MVNFGPTSTVPQEFTGRLFHEHNSSVTLMRTTREECITLGNILARKVNLGDAQKTRVILPLRGVSLISVSGAPFFDTEADEGLLGVLRKDVRCPIVEVDVDINHPTFASAAVNALHEILEPRL